MTKVISFQQSNKYKIKAFTINIKFNFRMRRNKTVAEKGKLALPRHRKSMKAFNRINAIA